MEADLVKSDLESGTSPNNQYLRIEHARTIPGLARAEGLLFVTICSLIMSLIKTARSPPQNLRKTPEFQAQHRVKWILLKSQPTAALLVSSL